jgi:hypothetical protein
MDALHIAGGGSGGCWSFRPVAAEAGNAGGWGENCAGMRRKATAPSAMSSGARPSALLNSPAPTTTTGGPPAPSSLSCA